MVRATSQGERRERWATHLKLAEHRKKIANDRGLSEYRQTIAVPLPRSVWKELRRDINAEPSTDRATPNIERYKERPGREKLRRLLHGLMAKEDAHGEKIGYTKYLCSLAAVMLVVLDNEEDCFHAMLTLIHVYELNRCQRPGKCDQAEFLWAIVQKELPDVYAAFGSYENFEEVVLPWLGSLFCCPLGDHEQHPEKILRTITLVENFVLAEIPENIPPHTLVIKVAISILYQYQESIVDDLEGFKEDIREHGYTLSQDLLDCASIDIPYFGATVFGSLAAIPGSLAGSAIATTMGKLAFTPVTFLPYAVGTYTFAANGTIIPLATVLAPYAVWGLFVGGIVFGLGGMSVSRQAAPSYWASLFSMPPVNGHPPIVKTRYTETFLGTSTGHPPSDELLDNATLADIDQSIDMAPVHETVPDSLTNLEIKGNEGERRVTEIGTSHHLSFTG